MTEDTYIRLAIFLALLALLGTLEAIFPKKNRTQSQWQRWKTNLVLVVINSLSLRLLGGISAVAIAYYSMHQSWGLLSRLPLPYGIDIIVGILLMDLAIYFQHVCSHKIPFLWRFHKVHHSDRDIDVTTGIRFHPIEIVFSMLYKCVIILLLGPLPLAIIVFEILLNSSAMFNHANLKLPQVLDKVLRLFIVTPDMHRIHHSILRRETDSNYGFFLSCWDKLFRTYIKEPEAGQDQMTIGLPRWQTDQPSKLTWLLILPFKSEQ